MRPLSQLLVAVSLVAGLSACVGGPPLVVANDNRVAAGTDLEGVRDIVLEAFSIQGPGQLRFICPKDIDNDGLFYDMKGCRVSWRHVLQPEKLYFHGTCGDTVEVPGLYVAVDPDAK